MKYFIINLLFIFVLSINAQIKNILIGNANSVFIGDTTTPAVCPDGIDTLIFVETSWVYSVDDVDLNWDSVEYDDTGWLDSNAIFGTESNLTITTPITNASRSFFFRQTFNVCDSTKVSSLDLTLLFDDGIGIWINGVLAYNSSNMGSLTDIPPAWDAIPSSTHEATSYEGQNIDGMISNLFDGDNIIAIGVWNRLSSSDIVFDATLSITYLEPASDTTAPDVPTNFIANSDYEQNSLGWDNVTDEAGYEISRGVEGVLGGSKSIIDTTGINVITYTDIFPDSGDVYEYYVKAFDDSSNISDASNLDSALTWGSIPAGSEGEQHFVDNAISSSGNGESWSTAWKFFDDIDWNVIDPGDTLYISGGSTSKTYVNDLIISKSGTSGNYIVVTKGISAGHNGTVIIDAATTPFIDIGGSRSYVEIANISFDGTGISDQLLEASGSTASAHHIILTNLRFDPIYASSSCVKFGGSSASVENITIRNCYFRQAVTGGGQTDCVYAQNVDSLYLIGNTLISANNETDPHSDGFQLNKCGDVWVENNKFFHVNTKTAFNQAMYSTENTGKIFIVNNLFYFGSPNSTSPVIAPSRLPLAGVDSCYFLQNTIIGETAAGIDRVWYDDMPYVVQYNNVAVEMGTAGYILMKGSGTTMVSDYNQVYKTGFTTTTNYFTTWGSSETLASWRAISGGDEHDENTTISQPTFTNFDWNFSRTYSTYYETYDFTIPSRASGKTSVTVWMGEHSFTVDGEIGWDGQ